MGLLFRSIVLLGSIWSFNLWAGTFPVLVDGEWLSKNRDEVVVLDVRPRADYIQGHLPHARWAGFRELEWQVERYGVPGYLPQKKQLAELLGNLGLNGSESLVVIGSAKQARQIAEATRVVWSLMMAGFDQVALLDGGIESLPVLDLVKGASPINATVCAIEIRTDLQADTNWVEGLLGDNKPVIDFRPTPFFEGYKQNPQVSEGGTIYDGVGIPPRRLLDNRTGRFLSAKAIQDEFESYDITTEGTIATFSDTGVWAALGWFVLHQILENPQTRLYDGSLVEWIDWGGEMHDSTDDMGGPIG